MVKGRQGLSGSIVCVRLDRMDWRRCLSLLWRSSSVDRRLWEGLWFLPLDAFRNPLLLWGSIRLDRRDTQWAMEIERCI